MTLPETCAGRNATGEWVATGYLRAGTSSSAGAFRFAR